MRFTRSFLIMIVWSGLATGLMFGKSPNLIGVWTGDTIVPHSPDKDFVTLVLKKDGASYSGTISDSMGMVTAAILENVKLEKDALTFEFVVTPDSEAVRILVSLRISGGKLVGSWESSDGATGDLTLTRQK